MNNPVNSNIYAFDAASVLVKYPHFVHGDANCTILVVSKQKLDEAARDAIYKSVDRLGFGADACAWVQLRFEDASCEQMSLSVDELLDLIEGLDPVSIITTDAASASALAEAYKAYGASIEMDATNRVNGRTVIVFSDFEGMLNDKDSKQRAWSLLKKLVPAR